jgi:pyruvate/2-oxoglutarate dehydrogenase complex dihydrolipoamide acyltransferase (E2) component
MFANNFRKLKNPASWRRLSVATWKAPNDPTVYGHFDVDITHALAFLEKINQTAPTKITMTHLIIKATALMMKKYPDCNGIIRWNKIYLRNTVDIFAQVAIAEASKGDKPDLSGAKIKQCDEKSLVEISKGLQAKSQYIREGEYKTFKSTLNLLNFVPDLLLRPFLRLIEFLLYDLALDLSWAGIPYDPFGTAMVTSVGALGTPAGYAPLVPLSRCPFIICAGTVVKKPWVVNDQVVPRHIIDIRGTFDHRFMDGLIASRMFHYFNEILATPEKFMSS